MDHSEMNHMMESFGIKCRLEARKCEDLYHASVARQGVIKEQNIGAPAETLERIVAEATHTSDGHLKGVYRWKQRANACDLGYIIHGPNESRDAEFQRDHGELIRAMAAAGRCRFVKDYSGEPGYNPEYDAEAERAQQGE